MRNVPRVVSMQHCGPVLVRLVPLLRQHHTEFVCLPATRWTLNE
jgi:hypothetical protein